MRLVSGTGAAEAGEGVWEGEDEGGGGRGGGEVLGSVWTEGSDLGQWRARFAAPALSRSTTRST